MIQKSKKGDKKTPEKNYSQNSGNFKRPDTEQATRYPIFFLKNNLAATRNNRARNKTEQRKDKSLPTNRSTDINQMKNHSSQQNNTLQNFYPNFQKKPTG